MKIKFDWGTGIAIFIVIFIGFYISLMLITKQREFDLVSEEYYPESIEFESRIEKTRNAKALDERLQINVKGDSIKIILPDWKTGNVASGTLYFYRPNNSLQDISVPLVMNSEGEQMIDAGEMKTGRYIAKVEWIILDTKYYDEITIYIP